MAQLLAQKVGKKKKKKKLTNFVHEGFMHKTGGIYANIQNRNRLDSMSDVHTGG